MQPASGGFLESAPLTSFVVMSLASSGRSDHPVVRKGVEFLLSAVRPDGSWPSGDEPGDTEHDAGDPRLGDAAGTICAT